MKIKPAYIVLTLITTFLFYYFLSKPVMQPAGDIPEYYGITQTLLSHFGFNLTSSDQEYLSKVLNPGYFNDPGYYIQGRGQNRYPVHFVFYSILVLPIRLILKLLNFNELLSLSITNLIILSATVLFILIRFLKSTKSQLIFILLVYISPVVFFIIWPGPDIFYTCMMLISVFYFFERGYFKSALFGVLASWHSQPLAIYAGLMTLFFILKELIRAKEGGGYKVTIDKKVIKIFVFCLILALLVLTPYFLNYYMFGILTPWKILQDGWTIMRGFGVQNTSLVKLYEMFFDLNIGLFWYAPFIVILGTVFVLENVKKADVKYMFFCLLFTAFFYQTNPAWHYGTSGYGPTRHVIFVLPFFIYCVLKFLEKEESKIELVSFIVILTVVQFFPLKMNNFLRPFPPDSLRHNQLARFVLDNYPSLYNPTPEIFIDRTSNTDPKNLINAVYKKDFSCKKAFILKGQNEYLMSHCGSIPTTYQQKLDDPFSRKANYPRTTYVLEATLWPDSSFCTESVFTLGTKDYVCIRDLDTMLKTANITDKTRVKPYYDDAGESGVWYIPKGNPLKITVPAGYIMDYYGQEGIYVNY